MNTPTIIRTGPVTFRECGSCDGIGDPHCPNCKGLGRITVDVHPFGTLEALYEHVGALQGALRKAGIDPEEGPMGSPGYHLATIDKYAQSLLQQLILLLPEEWARTEGE